MTAKELKQQVINCFIAESGLEYPEGSIGWQMKQNKIEILHRFIDQLCREQREACTQAYIDSNGKDWSTTVETIRNAKQPEL